MGCEEQTTKALRTVAQVRNYASLVQQWCGRSTISLGGRSVTVLAPTFGVIASAATEKNSWRGSHVSGFHARRHARRSKSDRSEHVLGAFPYANHRTAHIQFQHGQPGSLGCNPHSRCRFQAASKLGNLPVRKLNPRAFGFQPTTHEREGSNRQAA